jgi:hypothetical protein
MRLRRRRGKSENGGGFGLLRLRSQLTADCGVLEYAPRGR